MSLEGSEARVAQNRGRDVAGRGIGLQPHCVQRQRLLQRRDGFLLLTLNGLRGGVIEHIYMRDIEVGQASGVGVSFVQRANAVSSFG